MNHAHTQPGPLAGITVIDLTRALAGPYATLQLADLGARVIKVETPNGGDDSRHFPPFIGDKSLYFSSINRDKESIALDLKTQADRVVFEQLLERADVLVENFRPGVMARLGFDWATLTKRHPRLVMASISGFGQDGPYAHRTAYDVVAQAMGGIMSITGEEDGPPARVGVSLGDLAAGLFATLGIQAALIERQRSGKGAQVDVSMLDCQVALLENAVARHLSTGERPTRLGSRHPTITPFAVYKAQDDFMAVCVGTEAQFRGLMAIIGSPELAEDERYKSIAARNDNQREFKEMLETALQTAPRAHWLRLMEEAGVPGGPVNSVADVVRDPQVEHRGMILEVEDPDVGPLKLAATPLKFSTQPRRRSHRPAPALDADRVRLLAELLQSGTSTPRSAFEEKKETMP